MKEFLKKYSLIKIIESLGLIAVGICLICLPNATLLAFCYLLGGGILLLGLCNLIEYVIRKFNDPLLLATCITQIIVGIFVLGFAKEMTSPDVFSILFGVVLLFYGLIRIQPTIMACQFHTKGWWWDLVSTFCLIIFSVVFMARLFSAQNVLLIFFGIVIILSGIWQLVSLFFVHGTVKRVKKEIRDEFQNSDQSSEDDSIIIDVDDNSDEQ